MSWAWKEHRPPGPDRRLYCRYEIARDYDNRQGQNRAVSAGPSDTRDKSAFLRAAGYTLDNADRLLDDLRSQILPLDAIPLENGRFGQYYEIRGTLSGPTGVVRAVRTIWITEHLSGIRKFVTLTPDKRSTT